MSSDEYTFPDLPLSPIPPGTNVLVEGPYHGGTRDVAFRMLATESGEGHVIVSTTSNADQLEREYRALGLEFDPRRTGIIDCIGDPSDWISARQYSASSPRDLTAIAMRLSKALQDFSQDSIRRVRLGIVSVSPLLTLGDVRSVFRFISAIAGRISNVDGIGVFVVDPAAQDTRTIETLAQFMQGRVQIREQEETIELRTLGMANQPSGWRAVTPPESGPSNRHS